MNLQVCGGLPIVKISKPLKERLLAVGFRPLALTLMAVPLLAAMLSCGGDADGGLSRAEVEEIVEESIATAIADIPQPEPQLTSAEAERIARSVVASIPPRSDVANYTKFIVDNAISRYQTRGPEAALAYYNSEESIDGQWYVFIVDENDLVIGHPDPQRLGLDLKGWVGTDANGYDFGSEMLSATGEGKWVSYVYKNPETATGGAGFGLLELKNAWVVRHDGLLFGSGWYIGAEDFTKRLVSVAVDTFRSGGLEATVAYFAEPESALAGLADAIAYYNRTDTFEGEWFAFIADESGHIVAHSQPPVIGTDLTSVLGVDVMETAPEGRWVASESLRVWLVEHEGWLFGSGWRRHGTAN